MSIGIVVCWMSTHIEMKGPARVMGRILVSLLAFGSSLVLAHAHLLRHSALVGKAKASVETGSSSSVEGVSGQGKMNFGGSVHRRPSAR